MRVSPTQVAFFCLYGGCTVFDTPYTGTTSASTMASTAGQGPDMIGASYMWWHVFVALAVFVGLPFIFMRRESTSVSTLGYGFLLATMAGACRCLVALHENFNADADAASCMPRVTLRALPA